MKTLETLKELKPGAAWPPGQSKFMKMTRTSTHPAVLAWWAFGGLLALGVAWMTIRELPSIRRELRLMRM